MFVVEEAEGWEDAAAWLPSPPKEPLLESDSAARESEVMVPADSTLGCDVPWGSLVTCEGGRVRGLICNGYIEGAERKMYLCSLRRHD